jgi:hypothetical protein
MKTFLITIAGFLILHGTAVGQPGFSKWFDFGLAANFHNIVLKEDTLFIAGTAKDPATSQWGALFVKMDTNGVIADYRLHLDSLGGQFAFDQGYPFLSTSDGGFLLVGKVFNRESYFLYKLHANGEVGFFKEYTEPPEVRIILPEQILEVKDGYLVFSKKQIENFRLDIYITKIDYQGNIVWENDYGAYNIDETVGSIWQEDDNTIVLGASKATDQHVNFPAPLKCGSSWIFAIDSLGAPKWEWQSAPCEGNIVRGLHRTGDGGWIYATRDFQAFNAANWGAAPTFVKRDSLFNLLWERRVADSYWDSNEMLGLAPTPDGHWVGAGRWVMPEPYNSMLPGDFFTPACLYKINEQGDSLWSRCDTVSGLEHRTLFHRYGGIVVLPSGSIIGAGGFKEEIIGVGDKPWGWVTKVDGQGCLQAPCEPTSVEEELPSEAGLCRVYPNPARDWAYLDANRPITGLTLFQTNGQVVKRWGALPENHPIDLSPLPEGVYYLEIWLGMQRVVRRMVKMR